MQNDSDSCTTGGGILTQARLALALTALLFAAGSPNAEAARPPHAGPKPANSINLVPTITSIEVIGGELFASGTATAVIHGKTTTAPFTTTLDISLAPNQNGAVCPILDLELGPIILDLLGLVVETSPICLQITAYEGGGLLGDLLCAVANLLAGGLTLDQILAGQSVEVAGVIIVPGLTPGEIGELLGGLVDLFNEALGNLLDAILTIIFPGPGALSCAILHLELGPLTLNLLGLEVILDDCDGGPVTVDITAERGRGNLLGNLLCGLLGDGLISLGTTLQGILNQLLALLSL